jgi:hypothetical protein
MGARPGTYRRRLGVLLAAGAATAVMAAGCTHRPHRPTPTSGTRTTPPPTTAAPTTAVPTTTTTTGPTTTTTVPGHGHGHEPGDDKGWSLLNNGHQHEHEDVPLDAATQLELDRQLAVTRQLIDRFPNVAAATAAGYRRAGPFAPGLGAHYMEPITGMPGGSTNTGPITDQQLLHPMLIFNGVTPEAPLIGFMYMVSGTKIPEGFAGPNDTWHYHTNVCVAFGPGGVDVPLGADRDVTAEQCRAAGGNLIPNTGYMAHLWTVPGWENPDGLFSELNRKVTCRDGTYYMIPYDQVSRSTTMCRDEATAG